MCAPTRAHLQTIDAANTQACSHYMGLLSSNTYPTRWRGGADPQRSKRDSKPCGKRLAQIHNTETSSNAWRHTKLHDATPLQHAAHPLHFTTACPHNATPRRAWSELADGRAGMKGEVEKRHMVRRTNGALRLPRYDVRAKLCPRASTLHILGGAKHGRNGFRNFNPSRSDSITVWDGHIASLHTGKI